MYLYIFPVTDRHHFDNPVYCYPTGGGGATAAIGSSNLNNARIRNDLGGSSNKSNLSNLERAKLGACATDDDCSEGDFRWTLSLYTLCLSL